MDEAKTKLARVREDWHDVVSATVARPELLISGLLVLLFVCLFAVYEHRGAESPTPIVDCSSSMCGPALRAVPSDVLRRASVDLRATRQDCHADWMPFGPRAVRMNAGTLFVPMSADPNMGQAIPDSGKCSVRLVINDARSVRVYSDGGYVYGHRYSEPEFWIGNVTGGDGSGSFTLRVWPENSRLYDPEGVALLGGGFASAIAALVLLLLTRRRGMSRKTTAGQNSRHGGRNSAWVERFHRQTRMLLVAEVALYATAVGRWALNRPLGSTPDVRAVATNTPFTQAGPRFSDFYQISWASLESRPFAHAAVDYPAAALLALRPFANLTGLAGMAAFMTLAVALLLWGMWTPNGSTLLVLVGALAFPLAFGLDRGNMDLIAAALVGVGLRVLERSPRLCGMLLGLAAAIKLWPIVFVVIVLRGPRRLAATVSWGLGFGLLSAAGWLVYRGAPWNALGRGALGPSMYMHVIGLREGLAVVLDALGTHAEFSAVNSIAGSIAMTIFAVALAGMLILLAASSPSTAKGSVFLALLAVLVPGGTYVYRATIVVVAVVQYWGELSSSDGLAGHVPRDSPRLWNALWLGPVALAYFDVPGLTVGLDSILVPGCLLFLTYHLSRESSSDVRFFLGRVGRQLAERWRRVRCIRNARTWGTK